MKKLLYKFVTYLVIVSIVFNNLPSQAASAQAAGTIQASAENQRLQMPSLASRKNTTVRGLPGSENPPTPTPKPVSTQIPPTGGAISSEKGEFSITFSASFGTAFEATLTSFEIGNALVSGFRSLGAGYSLTTTLADGTNISSFAPQPAPTEESEANAANNFIITVKYTDEEIAGLNETTLSLYTRAENGEWGRLPSTVNTDENVLTAQADKPGDFGIFAKRQMTKASTAGTNLKLVLDPDNDVGWAIWSGTKYTELPFNVQLAGQVRDKLAEDACTVDVLLTRETANPDSLNPSNRAQQATDFGADMFVTIAFNSLQGSSWGGIGNGGIEAWARSGQPDDDALVNQFFSQIATYTGRPHRKPIEHPSRYGPFNAFPSSMTYAHIETLFLDHKFDWPIIETKFEAIRDAAYAAIRTQLEAKGMVCTSGNPLPAPPSAEELLRMRNLGYQPKYQSYGADPVSFSTGNHLVQRDLFSLPQQGEAVFNFSLVYNSQDTRDGYGGVGWSAPIPYIQLYNDDSLTVTLEDGRAYYFTPNGSGYNTPDDLHVTLTRTDTGWLWTDADGSTMTFTQALLGFGPLTERRERHGDAYTYTYDFEGQAAGSVRPSLQSITDTVGNVINFDSDQVGHITGIHLPGNRNFTFEYNNSNLTKITDPNGNFYHYEYDNQDLLIKQWDAEDYLFLQNTYDDLNRVIHQIDASGSELSIDYDNDMTTYTDNEGKVTKYYFDDQKRVTSIQDALGVTTTTTYDAQDNITERTDGRNNHFSFGYDGLGNPETVSGPNNYNISYTYNQYGDLLSMTDNGGLNGQPRSTTFGVNGSGDVESIQYADGSSIQLTYDGHGNLKTSKDERGNITTYNYDGKSNLTEVISPRGKTTFTYDDAARKTSMTDANGHTVKFGYDANGNITQIIDPKNQPTSFVYDKNDNLITLTDRRGGVSSFTYDENLKLKTEIDPEGNVTRYAYDRAYNLIRVIDPEGNVTQYKYNDRYEVEQIIAANGGVTRFGYDADGNVIQIIDAFNQVSHFEYNGLNQPTAEIDPLNGHTSIGYDDVGRMVEQINPRGAKTIFSYDLRDRVIRIEDALHGISTIDYDLAGNPVTYTDANQHSATLEYDAVNQLISYTDAASQVTRFDLDPVGNLLKVTDALNRITTYGYDANDNVTSVLDALNHTTSFTYDPEDNLKTAKDARGNTTTFEYNLNGLMSKLIEAGGQTSSFVYNGNGSLKQFTNAKGNHWDFGYNALNQRKSETNPLSQTTQYQYDLLGRLVNAIDANGIITRYDYDALSHLTAVTQNDAAGGTPDVKTKVTTNYTYDAVGNLTSTVDANGNSTVYTYDLLDRLTEEKNALNDTWQYFYDPKGNLTERIDGNKNHTQYSYTVTDLLEHVSYSDNTSAHYTYDAVGNQLTANTSTLGTITNVYDALNRLKSSTDSAQRKIAYGYDEVGNKIRIIYPDGKVVRYAYDATNYLSQMTDPAGKVTKIARDATHNATLIQDPNLTLAKYEFDPAEQLKSVTNLHNNGRLINRFEYKLDAVGNRVETIATYPKQDLKGNPIPGRKTERLITEYQYDPLYRLTSSMDNLGRNSTYTYDAVGNRKSLTANFDPAENPGFQNKGQVRGLALNYEYNQINSLMKITQGDTVRDLSQMKINLNSFINEVQGQAGKQIDSTTANALVQAANAILTQIQSGSPDETTLTTAVNALSQQVQTARDQKKIKSEGTSKSLLAKLKLADDGNKKGKPKAEQETEFKYDGNGNRIEQRLTRFDGKNVPNDNGQHGVDIHYQYDLENRLVNVSGYLGKSTGNGLTKTRISTSMVYDAYGRLFERNVAPGNSSANQAIIEKTARKITQFVYDGLDPIVEYTLNKQDQVNDGKSVKHNNFYRADGRIISMLTNAEADYAPGRMYYFHYDGLNSVVALSKHIGQSVHNYQYGDFGTLRDNNGKTTDSSNFTDPHNHYTYTGQEWDENTGLYHFYAREYDPSTGTWLQQDPYRGQLADPMSLHRYGYVENNPISFLDFYGYLSCPIGGSSYITCFLNHSYFSDVNYKDEIDEKEFNSLLDAIHINVNGKFGIDSINLWFYDTPFWNGTKYTDETICYKGKCSVRSDVNYIGIGMYAASLRLKWEEVQKMIRLWKKGQHNQDTVSDDTFYWAKYGYDKYIEMEKQEGRYKNMDQSLSKSMLFFLEHLRYNFKTTVSNNWNKATQPISNTWNKITQPISNAWNSLWKK